MTNFKSFSDELQKIAAPPGLMQRGARFLVKHEDPVELAGLGVLGTIGADRLQAHARAGTGASEHDVEKKQLMGETGHAGLDTAGLAMLAAPLVAKKLVGH